MGFLHGKRALITGVLNHRSIAWGIASAMHREGAELAFTYVNDKLKDRVDEAATAFGSNIVLPCDVADDAQIDALFPALARQWDGLDILVHSIGFAPREALAQVNAIEADARLPARRVLWLPGNLKATGLARVHAERHAELRHHVRSGETLWTIARANRVGVRELEQWNHLRGSALHPGQWLRLTAPD